MSHNLPTTKRVLLTDEGMADYDFDVEGPGDTVWDVELVGFGVRHRNRKCPTHWSWIYLYRDVANLQHKANLGKFLHTPAGVARGAALQIYLRERVAKRPLWEYPPDKTLSIARSLAELLRLLPLLEECGATSTTINQLLKEIENGRTD